MKLILVLILGVFVCDPGKGKMECCRGVKWSFGESYVSYQRSGCLCEAVEKFYFECLDEQIKCETIPEALIN